MSELDGPFSELHQSLLDSSTFVRAVFSGRRRNMQPLHERVDMRPVQLKSGISVQVSYSDGRAMTTKNFSFKDLPFMEFAEAGYSNILIESELETLSLKISKKGSPLLTRSKSQSKQSLAHDHVKTRLLDASDPFLIEVGISDHNGRVKPSMMDKYKQVEEFLRLLVPTLQDAIEAGHVRTPDADHPLVITDLGCGHAYLTFAAHQYLQAHQIPVRVIGIDIRESSRDRNNQIAQRLNISGSIEFRAEEISATNISKSDVAIALHACDTATDDAIAWAVNNGVPLALFAPCCHHDIQAQLKVAPEPWSLITRHGIMRERLADLITDGLRIQLMKSKGYRVDAIEFIAGSHTPRNLMIRAVFTGAKSDGEEARLYEEMLTQWGVTPVLAAKLNR
jgi:hypothetical protein